MSLLLSMISSAVRLMIREMDQNSWKLNIKPATLYCIVPDNEQYQ